MESKEHFALKNYAGFMEVEVTKELIIEFLQKLRSSTMFVVILLTIFGISVLLTC